MNYNVQLKFEIPLVDTYLLFSWLSLGNILGTTVFTVYLPSIIKQYIIRICISIDVTKDLLYTLLSTVFCKIKLINYSLLLEIMSKTS